MEKESRINIYNYTVGTAFVILLLSITISRGFIIYDKKLFLFLIIIEIVIDKFNIRTPKVWISFASIIELASFLLLGIVNSAWIQLIFIFVTDYLMYKKPFNTVFLNAGMTLSKMFAGSIAYKLVFESLGSMNERYFSVSMFLPALSFTVAAFICNYIFIFIQFYLINNKLDMRDVFDSMKWEIISLFFSIPAASEFADIYKYSSSHNLWFSTLFILPIVFACFIFTTMKSTIFANKQLKALSKVALTINKFLDVEKTYNSVLDAINSLVSFKGCYIFDMKDEEGEMIPVAYRMDDDFSDKVYSFSVEESILGQIVHSSKAIIINDLYMKPGDKGYCEYCTIYKSCILVPMRRLNKCIGCIIIFSDEYRAFGDEILEFLMILSDQATIAIENAKLFRLSEEEAITDGLTYLYNQRFFYSCIEKKIRECEKNSDAMSLIIFDIDYFKRINDTYGHLVGDFVIREVARLIKSSVRKNDIVSRYGGEEFTVILPSSKSMDAYAIAERIRKRVEDHIFRYKTFNIKLTISGGISEYPNPASNAMEMVSFADRAMYSGAKEKGRNKIKIYDTGML
ncbi:MAG: sensor domain-containing diguanylate cyclase [Clostridiales bacterium]|nr:sensor domain-containing diguanylate cyclase [Clostridiales bacterium]HBM79461.1 hypothetical protein [Clostridiaceae bacterium]